MNSFRLRLDIGIDCSVRDEDDVDSKKLRAAATGVDSKLSTNNNASRPTFEISYNHHTTFVNVLREIIETYLLDGKLLQFLQCNSSSRGQSRDEVYVLLYSSNDATLIQPYWSSRGRANGAPTRQDGNRQLLLQLGMVGNDTFIEPSTSVGSFLGRHSSQSEVEATSSAKKRKINNSECIDMKLRVTLTRGHKPSNINILLCEEHRKQQNKLLKRKVLCTPKPTSLATTAKPNLNLRHKPLRSLLLHNFVDTSNRLLLAMAFLIPTTLILGGIDTLDGVQLSVDKPSFCQTRALNMERPAVLRQYFGLDFDDHEGIGTPGRDDVVWRSCYGVGSGAVSVGIHSRHSTTREMTHAMKMIAGEIFQYLKARFDNGDVVICPFNHVTVLFYYQKVDSRDDDDNKQQPMLGFHTDNVYSYDGLFVREANSQMENTFTVLLSLGDERILHFRRQEISNGKHNGEHRRKWVSDKHTLIHTMRHGALFLLHPRDESPTQSNPPNGPTHRYQHGDVKFTKQDEYKLSAALAFRTVTTKELVYRETGKLYHEQPVLPQMLPPPPGETKDDVKLGNGPTSNLHEPEMDFLLDTFHREKLLAANEKLKSKWMSVAERCFGYRTSTASGCLLEARHFLC